MTEKLTWRGSQTHLGQGFDILLSAINIGLVTFVLEFAPQYQNRKSSLNQHPGRKTVSSPRALTYICLDRTLSFFPLLYRCARAREPQPLQRHDAVVYSPGKIFLCAFRHLALSFFLIFTPLILGSCWFFNLIQLTVQALQPSYLLHQMQILNVPGGPILFPRYLICSSWLQTYQRH